MQIINTIKTKFESIDSASIHRFAKNWAPVLIMAFMMLATSAHASGASTAFGSSMKSGFCSIYDVLKMVAGAIGLIMVVIHAIKFMGGDKDALKMIIATVVGVLVVFSAPAVIDMFASGSGWTKC